MIFLSLTHDCATFSHTLVHTHGACKCVHQHINARMSRRNVTLWQAMLCAHLDQSRSKVLCSLPQAEALQAAGHVPDHVIMLAAPQPILADRARHRLVDPVTRHIYHIPSVPGALSAPIAPTLPDGSPAAVVAARLVPRGDDSVPNVQHRLTVWTKHARSDSSWL